MIHVGFHVGATSGKAPYSVQQMELLSREDSEGPNGNARNFFFIV